MTETSEKTKNLVIELDLTLTAIEIKEKEAEDFNKTLRAEKQTTVRDCVSGKFRHKNYMDYLGMAWANHYGVVISPDIFWFVMLNESASHIKDNSEYYRSLFTATKEGKVEIVVPTADPQLISLELIAEKLRELVPTDIDVFMPQFSTSTDLSAFAFKAAFADAMSPFYNYSMFMCGIPKVKVQGTVEDWNKLSENVEKLKVLLNKNSEIIGYFDKVINLSNSISGNFETPNSEFWKGMFSLERCGSGGQVEVMGWIKDLFIKVPRPGYINNYPTNVATVEYTYLNTGQKFELKYGLFSSNIEEGFLNPDFGFIINEK